MEDISIQEGLSWFSYYMAQITDFITIGDNTSALAAVTHELEIWPDNPYLLYVKSIILLNLERPDDAIQILEHIRVQTPHENTLTISLSRNLMFQGYYHNALSLLSHYEFMTDALAGETKFTLNMCRAFIDGNISVIEYCDELIELISDKSGDTQFLADIKALKMVALIKQGEINRAIAVSETINEEHEDQYLVAYAKGIVLWKEGNLTDAEILLRYACQIQPLYMQSKADLADLLTIMGEKDEALEIRKKISGFFGEYNSTHNPLYRAEELIKNKDYTEAFRFISWAMIKNPEDRSLLIPHLSVLYFTGQYEQIINLAATSNIGPYCWKSIYIQASAFYTSGKVLNAIRCLISAAARDRLSFIYTTIRMSLEGFFKEPEIQSPESMAFNLFLKDGLEAFVTLFESIAQRNREHAEHQVFLTICYMLMGRYCDALLTSELFATSDEVDFILIRILAYRATGCLNGAEREAKFLKDNHQDSVPVLNMYTRILLEQERYRDAYIELQSKKEIVLSDATLQEVWIRCSIRAGEFHDAAVSAIRLLTNYPDRHLDHYLLAKACLLDREYNGAIYALREGFRKSGVNTKTLTTYIKLLLLTSEPSEAVIIFNEFKRYFPDSSEIRYLSTAAKILSGEEKHNQPISEYSDQIFKTENGTLRRYIGDYRTSAQILTEEVQSNQKNPALRISFAAALYELEQYGEGLHQISLVNERDEDILDRDGYLSEGLQELGLGNSIEDLVRISNNNQQRLANLVHERACRFKYFGLKKYAIEACMYLTALPPNSPEIFSLKADAYHMLGDLKEQSEYYDEAVKMYSRLIQDFPENAVYLSEKGLILSNLNRHAEAEKVLRKALKLDKNLGSTYSALCWALSSQGKHREALHFGNKAVILNPDEWEAWNNRGLAKLGLQDLQDAVHDFKQAVRCHPYEIIARRNLCGALLTLEDTSAYEEYEQLIVRFGKDAFPEDGKEEASKYQSRNQIQSTVTGYLDGYW